jgi:hypothetical protein
MGTSRGGIEATAGLSATAVVGAAAGGGTMSAPSRCGAGAGAGAAGLPAGGVTVAVEDDRVNRPIVYLTLIV